jgi:predicted ATP-binding protein involved in virulence
MKWSTGHKICLHVIASLVAHAVPQSLVLFDEPEAHLHPPLTAALMHGVRIALERTEAFAVIATHSPVVLQETLARHVRVIERRGDLTTLRTPNGETFGENIGTIVYDTFGLTASGTDYHEVLEALASVEKSVESIDEYFSPSLSAQARSYILALLGSETDETSNLE